MKSTIEGFLALLLAIFGAVLAYQIPAAMLTPQLSHIWLWVTASLTLATAIGRAVIGYLQNDAPSAATLVQAAAQAQTAATLGTTATTGGQIKSSGPLVKAVLLAGLISFALLPLCAFSCSGSQQQQAAQASLQASTVIVTAQQAEIALYGQSLDTAAEHQFIETQFDAIGQIGTTVDACIGSASQTNGVFTCLNTAITKLDAINAQGGLELKSAQAKAGFAAAVLGVRTVLASIEVTLGGTPPVASVTAATN